MAHAAMTALRARGDLGESFTMSPAPLSDAVFIERGIYRAVRHPMYSSVLSLILGYAVLLRSRFVGVGWVACIVYLILKMRHEETQLVNRYPAYIAYRERVPWRLLPRVY
jgi:protein-S-isoprenylcysteine O-methyltransferase Ste14